MAILLRKSFAPYFLEYRLSIVMEKKGGTFLGGRVIIAIVGESKREEMRTFVD